MYMPQRHDDRRLKLGHGDPHAERSVVQRPEDDRKVVVDQRSIPLADMYLARGQCLHDDRPDQQHADMYGALAEDRSQIGSTGETDPYPSIPSEHSDMQTDMSPYSCGQADTLSDRGVYGGQCEVPPPSSSPRLSVRPYIQCLKCKEKIRERHLVLINDGRFLHERCVRCEVCMLPIRLTDNTASIFLRDNKLYCRNDYIQLFSTEPKREMPCCIKCNVQVERNNWVRRADNYVFHMTCFCCAKCNRQLSGYETFVLRDARLICEKHFYENDGTQKGDSPKPRTKRMRTSFTEEQVKVLQHHFAIDSNPDGQDLERIAKLTGLKKRVTQVWFQNNRARHKKSLQQKPGVGGVQTPTTASSSSSLPPDSFSSPLSSSSAVYISTSEEGDSGQGNELSAYPADLDPAEDNVGLMDFAQQPLCGVQAPNGQLSSPPLSAVGATPAPAKGRQHAEGYHLPFLPTAEYQQHAEGYPQLPPFPGSNNFLHGPQPYSALTVIT